MGLDSILDLPQALNNSTVSHSIVSLGLELVQPEFERYMLSLSF